MPPSVWPVVFTVAALLFLFGLKRLYRAVERLMTFFLVFMFLAFLVNLLRAGPSLGAAVKGAFVPSIPPEVNWVTLGGLVATTFVIVAAFFQSYLVKAKGWGEEELADGIADTVSASVMFTLIGTVLMMTAAAVLHPHAGRVDFAVMTRQLESVFGPYARLIFAIGFWAAAFSSFVTNSLAGGVMFADGLGLGGDLESKPSKSFAALVLVIGMTTSLLIIRTEERARQAASTVAAAGDQQSETEPGPPTAKPIDLKVASIRLGQASTLLAIPLGALAMVVVLFDKRANKGRPLSWHTKTFVLFGAAILLANAFLVYTKIKPELLRLFGFG